MDGGDWGTEVVVFQVGISLGRGLEVTSLNIRSYGGLAEWVSRDLGRRSEEVVQGSFGAAFDTGCFRHGQAVIT